MGDWDKDYRLASMVGRNPEIVRDAANVEIERLKAALHRIADDHYTLADTCQQIAQRALEGKDDLQKPS